MSTKAMIGWLLAASILMAAAVPTARAADDGIPGAEIDRTPPRLSFADGTVSFWRPGAQDWVPAQVNTPLAPGDELYTGAPGNLELQIGYAAFLRAWGETQVGLGNQEAAYAQFKVTAGHAALDLRALEPGRTVEVATPSAAFTIDRAGYYRVDVDGDRTAFVIRRSGQAVVTLATGQASLLGPGQQAVIEGAANPLVATGPAPAPDAWDQWNEARTTYLVNAASARYVAGGIYGVTDLDRYGSWRTVPTYGAVWAPAGMPAGWAPYSTGTWMLDPYYGWTWVDAAPWGWAPYHYGRWVFLNGYWAWAPGPVPVRAAYAPALVAFYGGSPRVGVAGGPVGWVALGWGEPVVPWWGRPGFAHVPWWGGWNGPRVVNNVVITKTTVVNVQNITVYRNAGVQHAVTVVDREHFGRGPITGVRNTQVNVKDLSPTHSAPQVAAVPASFVPTTGHGPRPPEKDLKRPVVGTSPSSPRPAPGPMPPAASGPPAAPEPKVGRPASPAGRPAGPPPKSTPQVATPPRPPDGPQVPGRPGPSKNPVEVPGPAAPHRSMLPGPGMPPGPAAGPTPQGAEPQRRPAPGPMPEGPAVNRPMAPSTPRPEPSMTRPAPPNEPPRAQPGAPSGQMRPAPADIKQLQRVGHQSPHRDAGDAPAMRKKDRRDG